MNNSTTQISMADIEKAIERVGIARSEWDCFVTTREGFAALWKACGASSVDSMFEFCGVEVLVEETPELATARAFELAHRNPPVRCKVLRMREMPG